MNDDGLREEIASISRVGLKIQAVFLAKGETYAGEVAQITGVKFYQMAHLFYCLREIGLIEFSREEEYYKPINIRYHRIVAGKEYDPRWQNHPHIELYPSARLGSLRYERGTSTGRAPEYAEKEQ